jgi:cytochrome c peroxidase
MGTWKWVTFAASGLLVLLANAPASADPPLTPLEQLGKHLFFDNISEPARSLSCASCHGPKAGWTGEIAGINAHGAVYRGAERKRFGNRKPPSAAYAAYSPVFHLTEDGEFEGGVFWDGRATGERLGSPVAEQALGPFLNPVEQNMPEAQAVCDRVQRSKYAGLFESVWGPGSLDCSEAGVSHTYDTIGLSIGAYEASAEVNPFDSKFDDYWRACLKAGNSEEACGLAEGEKILLDPNNILTDQEFAGLIEFGEYCSACHISHIPGPGGTPPLFTDNRFDNIGVPRNPKNPFYKMDTVYLDDGTPINPEGEAWVDLGLGGFLRTRDEWNDLADENDGKHRVPTVRNVDARPGKGWPKAYMHNGALKSLEEVVSFYNTRDVPGAGWPPPEVAENVNREIFEGVPLGNFELDAEDEAAIVAFLRTLTDRNLKKVKAPSGAVR